MTLTRKVIKSWSAVVTYVGATEGKALVDRVMTSVKGGVLECAVIMRGESGMSTWKADLMSWTWLIASLVGSGSMVITLAAMRGGCFDG